MFDRNDPVGQMAEKMGMLFAIMVDEMCSEFGEEIGKATAERAVMRFGRMRGSNIRNEVLKNEEEITFENMEKYYDLPPNNGWDSDVEIKGGVLTEVTRYCPFASAWRELGLEDRGEVYCKVDIAINEGYFGKIDFERPSIFSDGPDAECKMIVKGAE